MSIYSKILNPLCSWKRGTWWNSYFVFIIQRITLGMSPYSGSSLWCSDGSYFVLVQYPSILWKSKQSFTSATPKNVKYLIQNNLKGGSRDKHLKACPEKTSQGNHNLVYISFAFIKLKTWKKNAPVVFRIIHFQVGVLRLIPDLCKRWKELKNWSLT